MSAREESKPTNRFPSRRSRKTSPFCADWQDLGMRRRPADAQEGWLVLGAKRAVSQLACADQVHQLLAAGTTVDAVLQLIQEREPLPTAPGTMRKYLQKYRQFFVE